MGFPRGGEEIAIPKRSRLSSEVWGRRENQRRRSRCPRSHVEERAASAQKGSNNLIKGTEPSSGRVNSLCVSREKETNPQEPVDLSNRNTPFWRPTAIRGEIRRPVRKIAETARGTNRVTGKGARGPRNRVDKTRLRPPSARDERFIPPDPKKKKKKDMQKDHALPRSNERWMTQGE